MLIGFEESDITSWKADLREYELQKQSRFVENKRSAFPERRNPLKDDGEMKKSQSATLNNSQLKRHERQQTINQRPIILGGNRYKYEKPYDIITLHPQDSSVIDIEKPKKNAAPIRNLYDPINGQRLKESLLQGRKIVIPPLFLKPAIENKREFNIVNNKYMNDNTARAEKEQMEKREKIFQKYNSSHVYDKIYGRYYNPEEEEKYWKDRFDNQKKNAQRNFESKLPPSYQVRQRYIQDPTQPLPEGLVKLDQKMENAKRHHQLKYIEQEKYQMKNIQAMDRKESMIMNRIRRTRDQGNLNRSAVLPSLPSQIKSRGFIENRES